jgi:hypothetical protein
MAAAKPLQTAPDIKKIIERACKKAAEYLDGFIFDAVVLKDVTLLLYALSRYPDPDPDPVVRSRLSMIINHHLWQNWYYEGVPLAVRIAYWAAVEAKMLNTPSQYTSKWGEFVAYLQESKARGIAVARSDTAGGWLFPGEPHVLWEIARLACSMEGDFCELGTWTGRSATVLCAAVQHFAPHKKVYLVDNWEWGQKQDIYPFMAEGRQVLIELRRQLQPYTGLYKDFSGMINELRDEIMSNVSTKGLALLHHDAEHDYENVYHDLTSYLPLLAQGGYLVVHDYNHPDNTGTKQAVDDIVKSTDASIFRVSVFNTIGLFRKGASSERLNGLSSIGTSRTSQMNAS